MRLHEDAWRAGYDNWKADPGPQGSVTSQQDEQDREQRWASFIGECRDFAASERDSYSAVLRAVAEAMKGQRELFRG